MKNEYAEKKKTMKKQLKKAMKEDDKKLDGIKQSGKDMIEYMQTENKKLKEKMEAMKSEYKVSTLFRRTLYILTLIIALSKPSTNVLPLRYWRSSLMS